MAIENIGTIDAVLTSNEILALFGTIDTDLSIECAAGNSSVGNSMTANCSSTRNGQCGGC